MTKFVVTHGPSEEAREEAREALEKLVREDPAWGSVLHDIEVLYYTITGSLKGYKEDYG